MSSPLVSVVIPTYNRIHYLREALDSIAAQTFRDYEVIVVDDGSTESIASGINGHPTNPQILRQARQGPATARNLGVAAARGEIIAFLDSDDLWLPEKLDRFIEALRRRPDYRIFYGPMQPIRSDGCPVAGRSKPCHEGWITEKLFCNSFIHFPTIVCYKEVFTAAGGLDPCLHVCEDYDLWLRVSLKEPFGLLEQPLALRRLHSDRLSKSCMRHNLAVKAGVLQRFFEAHGTSGRLRTDLARQRLARVFHAAAYAALRGRDFVHAAEYCRRSRSYGGSFVSNWLVGGVASVAGLCFPSASPLDYPFACSSLGSRSGGNEFSFTAGRST